MYDELQNYYLAEGDTFQCDVHTIFSKSIS